MEFLKTNAKKIGMALGGVLLIVMVLKNMNILKSKKSNSKIK